MHDHFVVLNEKEGSPATPGIDEPWIGVVQRTSYPYQEEHQVYEQVDSQVYIQPTQRLLIMQPYVLGDLNT